MNLVSLLFFGFLFAFVGSITPSMLNMTALKISLEKGKEALNKYALGVSIIVIPHVFIAVLLTDYITKNPTLLQILEKAGIIIFISLSLYFYNESKISKLKVQEVKAKKNSPLLAGITLSLLNVFSIPFFCATVVFLDIYSFFSFDIFPVLFFIFGSFLGTFYILFLYGKFAKKIQKKAGKLTKDINLVLCFLTGFVAIFTLIKQFI